MSGLPKLVPAPNKKPRKGRGGKLSRSEVVTVRLDPRLLYLAELAARSHRRTLSSYIDWVIAGSLNCQMLRPTGAPPSTPEQSIANEAEYLWDVDDADRLAKLALRYPHLMSHDEQVRWKLMNTTTAAATCGIGSAP